VNAFPLHVAVLGHRDGEFATALAGAITAGIPTPTRTCGFSLGSVPLVWFGRAMEIAIKYRAIGSSFYVGVMV